MKINDRSKLNQLPSVFLFDTDNTLYSYNEPHFQAMSAVKKKMTVMFSISEKDFENAFSCARQQIKERLEGQAASHSRLLYMQRVLELLGLGSQVLAALDLEQTYWRTFLSNAVLFDGVKELLDDIRILGIPAVVVTDLTAQIQFRKLVYFGLDNSFDFIVTSEEAGFDKPNPSPFNIAVDKAGAKEGTIWMIGDNPINDIKGAREAINATTIQKLHSGIEIGKGSCAPDATFDNFSELSHLLFKLRK